MPGHPQAHAGLAILNGEPAPVTSVADAQESVDRALLAPHDSCTPTARPMQYLSCLPGSPQRRPEWWLAAGGPRAAATRGSRPGCLGACAGRGAPARVDCTCLSAHQTYFSPRCTCRSGRQTHFSACGDLRQQWWTLASALAGLTGAVVVTCTSVRRTHLRTSRTRRRTPGASPSRTPDLHQR